MKKKPYRKFQKMLNVAMIVGILMSSFPITPFITKVNALSKVSGDRIIEVAQTYSEYTYQNVGTCTGLVTRTLNKLGVGTSIVGIHPYDINSPQAPGTGARYSPALMYQNAKNHPEDATPVWSGYVKDVKANAHLFKNGDLVIQRPEDKANYTGSGHVGLIRIYGTTISMYGANGDAAGIGDAILAQNIAPRGTSINVNSMDFIHVFRLTKAEPEYATLTSEKSANESVEVSFYKKDKDTNKPLSGVEVEFYRDNIKFAVGITDNLGIAKVTSIVTHKSSSVPKNYCTNYNDLALEEKNQVDEIGAYHSQSEAQAAADSEAQRKATELASQKHEYTVVETKTKTKYWLNPDNTTDSDSISGSGSISLNLTNERTTGTATLVKKDADVGYAQNEGLLDDALYGLYARENILDPADASIIYNAGDEITRVRIKDGSAKVENLYLGSYYWKELTSSEGYSLDKTEINFELKYSDQNVKVVTSNSVSKEEIIVGDFEIEKIITSGEESETVEKEEGAEFIAVAKKYVQKYGTIEEAWNHRNEFTDKEYDLLVTNKLGYAKSKKLAFGTFIVKQVKGKADTEMIKNEFNFVVSKENQDTKRYIINNRFFTSYIKLQKKDSETGKLITLSNTTFKIKNADTNEYLYQKVGDTTYTTWKTNNKGEVLLPLEVKAGNWILEELESPDFYLINKEGMEFKITNTNIIETDSDGDPILTVIMEDKAVKGQIKVFKKGESLSGITKDENGNIQFKYNETYLEGMKVHVQAAEDILDPADGSIIFSKGQIVDNVTTGTNGEGHSQLLPLGKYIVYEYEAPPGMVIDTTKHEVDLNFINNETEIDLEIVSITNARQKVKMNLLKLDKDRKTPVEGVIFNLYAKKDILLPSSEVLVKAGSVIETATTDKDGNLVFHADLPIYLDDNTYFEIKEEQKEGYFPNEESINIDTQYKGDSIVEILNSKVIYNEPIKNYILVNKVDSTTLKNITSKDFEFALCKDKKCDNIIEKYHADQQTGTALINIYYGEEMYVREIAAPEGYGLSNEVIKLFLNKEGLFVNDELVETNEDLIYSFHYQNTLLPIIQTGYEDNMPLYLTIASVSFISAISIIISLKKNKRKKTVSSERIK